LPSLLTVNPAAPAPRFFIRSGAAGVGFVSRSAGQRCTSPLDETSEISRPSVVTAKFTALPELFGRSRGLVLKSGMPVCVVSSTCNWRKVAGEVGSTTT